MADQSTVDNVSSGNMATLGQSRDQVVVQGWFGADASAALAQMVAGDGLKLDTGLGQIVSAMVGYQAANPGFNPASAATMPADSAVQAAIAAGSGTAPLPPAAPMAVT
jgi:hypothetical protein